MGAAVGPLLLAGGALQAAGSVQQGLAASEAAKMNARLTQRQFGLDFSANSRQEARDRAFNITQIAKSGVRRQGGSPAEVLALNAALASRQYVVERQSADLQADLFRARGRGARIGGGVSAAAQLLGAAGQAGAVRYRNA